MPRRSRFKTWLLPVLLLVLLGAGGTFWWLRQNKSAPATLVLKPETLIETLDITGVAQSERSVTLKAGVSARVQQRLTAENQRVPAGARLLALDTETLSLQVQQAQVNASNAIQQAETEVQSALNSLREAEKRRSGSLLNLRNQVQQAEENLFFIEQEYQRQQTLQAEGVSSQQSLAQQAQQLAQARLSLQNNRQSLATAETGDPELVNSRNRVQQARKALETAQKQASSNLELAHENLRQAAIQAPFAGSITNWNVERGDYVTPGTTLGRFQDLQDLRVYLAVNELDFPKIKRGNAVKIVFDAYPEQSFVGSVTWLSQASISDNENIQVFPVKVWFANPGDLIKPGMSGDAQITVAQREQVLAIPLSAIQRKDGKFQVQLLRDGKVEAQIVEVGISTLDQVEIRSGLKVGDELLLEPSDG